MAELSYRPIAIDRTRLESLLAELRSGEPQAAAPRQSPPAATRGREAVLPWSGLTMYGESFITKYFGGTDISAWIRQLQALGAYREVERDGETTFEVVEAAAGRAADSLYRRDAAFMGCRDDRQKEEDASAGHAAVFNNRRTCFLELATEDVFASLGNAIGGSLFLILFWRLR